MKQVIQATLAQSKDINAIQPEMGNIYSMLKNLHIHIMSNSRPIPPHPNYAKTRANKAPIWCQLILLFDNKKWKEEVDVHSRYISCTLASYYPWVIYTALSCDLHVGPFFHWNIDRSVEGGILNNKHGSWYNHDIILQLQHLLQEMPYADQFEDYTICKDLVNMGDTFVAPDVRELGSLQHIVPTNNGAN
jgi:hypothetical protein